MPIEIRELIIKATVTGQDSIGQSPGTSSPERKNLIIQECVEKVLRILKNNQER